MQAGNPYVANPPDTGGVFTDGLQATARFWRQMHPRLWAFLFLRDAFSKGIQQEPHQFGGGVYILRHTHLDVRLLESGVRLLEQH